MYWNKLLWAVSLVLISTAAAAETGDWTGVYVGAAPGVRFSDTKWSSTQTNGTSFNDGSSPRNYDLSQFRLQGYTGYNFQRGNWVFGPELNIAWANGKTAQQYFPGCGLACDTQPAGPNDTTTVRMKWDGELLGRLGYLVQPNVLIYGTGGLALQEIATRGTCVQNISEYCYEPFNGSPTMQNDTVYAGFAIGAGAETKLYDHWVLRGEYRFAYFPSMGNALNFPLPTVETISNYYGYKISDTTNTLTLGIAYKF